MANYTMRIYDYLRYLSSNDPEKVGYNVAVNAIDDYWQDIFDLDIWDTYDHDYKPTLCKKILRHYLMYEIGQETISLFKFTINTRLSEIMDKYNIMYKNIDKAYSNFFNDVDYTETSKKDGSETTSNTGESSGTSKETNTETGTEKATGSSENTGSSDSNTTNTTKTTSTGTSNATGSGTSNTTNKGTSTNNTDGWQAESDTPQGTLSGLENNNYMSSAVHTYGKGNSTTDTTADSSTTSANTTTNKTEGTGEQTNSATSNTTQNTSTTANTEKTNNAVSDITNSTNTSDSGQRDTTENYVKTVIGKIGANSNAQLYNEIVKNLTNIDEMIINDLKDCFMLLWE